MGVTRGYKQTEEHVRRQMASRAARAVDRKPVTREWLATKYVTEGLDCVRIAALVRRDPKSVWSWLRAFGIPTRPRGASTEALRAHYRTHGASFAGRTHSPETCQRLRLLSLADGRLPWGKHNPPYWRGRGGASHPSWKGGLTPERQALYATSAWIDAVKSVWARADARCERCHVHHNTRNRRGTFHVHHVVSFSVRELRATVSNLVLLCRECHHFIHSRGNTAREFLERPQ